MQTRRQSLVEAVASTMLGYMISVLIQLWLFPLYGIHVSVGANMQIVAIFTAVSIVRSFITRRYFNYLHRPKGEPHGN